MLLERAVIADYANQTKVCAISPFFFGKWFFFKPSILNGKHISNFGFLKDNFFE